MKFSPYSLLVVFKDTPGNTNSLGFAKIDTTKNTNATATIYVKLTDFDFSGTIQFVNDLDTVFISYVSLIGETKILSLEYSTGNVLNEYNFKQDLGSLRMRFSGSIMYLLYSKCCNTYNKLYYDIYNNPTKMCTSDAMPMVTPGRVSIVNV